MPKWTYEQQQAIYEKGNLLVSAAAGAGKTAVMTERIVKIISEGTSVNEILAVTFTNAAASEMKQRIAKRLSELAESEKNFEKGLFLNAAANDISHAAVSTFHSFCTNLLRRCCHEVNLDPAFRVADAAEAAALKYDAIDKTLEDAYGAHEKESSPSFAALCSVLKNDTALSELILNVYTFLMARPEPFDWLKTAVSAYGENFDEFAERAGKQLIKLAKRDIRVFYERADSLYRNLVSIFPDAPMKYEPVLFSDMEQLNAFLRLPGYEEWHNALKTHKFASLPRSGKGGKAPIEITDYRKALKAVFKKLAFVFSESLETEREEAKANLPVMNEILKLTGHFAEKYAESKKAASLVDFNDLEQFTLSALKNPEIASEYREKFKFIFIDEYQDTNSVQEKIISLIARNDNLFMVGDVKQSIYRFRQAEPENFLEKYISYDGKNGKRIDLNANFRSYTSVLSAVNLLFSKLMLGEIGEIDYSDNAALIAGNTLEHGEVKIVILTDDKQSTEDTVEKASENSAEENNPGQSSKNKTIGTSEAAGEADEDNPEDTDTEEVSADADADAASPALDSARAEALYTAKQILFLMENDLVFDKERNEKRKPVFSDFAVLLRKTKANAMQWVNMLTVMGIPCAADLGDGFFDAMEVQIFMNLLRIIDNKHQDIPLMSVLCSPIGNFTNKELVSVRCDYEGDCLYSKLLASSVGSANNPVLPRAKKFIEKLLLWQRESQFMKLDEFIGMLLDTTGFYACMGALNSGSIRKANLDMLINYAHNYEANGRRGLYGFITYMDSISERVNISAAAAPSLNAVHIMSIHKSKGLEFPIVFIGGLFNSFSEQAHRDYVLLDPLLGIGLKLRNKKLSKTLLHRSILARDDEKKLAEEMRVLYVAMTRAREKLYMIGCPPAERFDIEKYASPLSDYQIMSAKNYMKWIMGAFFPGGIPKNLGNGILFRSAGGDKIALTIEPRPSFSVSEEKMSRNSFASWKASALLSNPNAALKSLRFCYPHVKDTFSPSKKSVSELMGAPLEYSPAVPAFMEKTYSNKPLDTGTAVHRLLALLPLKAISEAELNAHINAFGEKNILSPGLITSETVRSVLSFLNSSLYERMLSSERVEREREFSLMLSESDIVKALKHKDNSVEIVENGSFFSTLSAESLVQGIIDCCFLENGEWVLIDYKTTALKNQTPYEVASRYETQLDFYALALEKLTGFKVKEKWIYLLSAFTAVLL